MSSHPAFFTRAAVTDRRRFVRWVAAAALAARGDPSGGASAQVASAATLRGSNIRLRQGAGIEFPALAILQGGQAVTATGRVQQVRGHLWREAVLPTGETGWISWEFFQGGSPVPGPGEVVVEAAGASVVSVEPPVVTPPAEEPGQAPPAGDRSASRRRDRKTRDRNARQPATGEDPAAGDAGAFASGGLGLSLGEAETIYGPSVEDALGRAWAVDDGQVILGFDDGEWSGYVERLFDPPVEFTAAHAEALRLAPGDATLISTGDRRGQTLEFFASPSLAARVGSADVWGDANPGEFVAAYGGYDPAGGVETVDRVVLALGDRI